MNNYSVSNKTNNDIVTNLDPGPKKLHEVLSQTLVY